MTVALDAGARERLARWAAARGLSESAAVERAVRAEVALRRPPAQRGGGGPVVRVQPRVPVALVDEVAVVADEVGCSPTALVRAAVEALVAPGPESGDDLVDFRPRAT